MSFYWFRSFYVLLDTVGGVVSICGLPLSKAGGQRFAALPDPSLIVAPLRLTDDTMRWGVLTG